MRFNLQLFGGRGGPSKLGGGIPTNGSARSSGNGSAIQSVTPAQRGGGFTVQTTNGAYDISPMGKGYTVDIGGDEQYFSSVNAALTAINNDASGSSNAPKNAAIPKSQVSVSTSSYQFSHGSTPRGSGSWAFTIGGETKFFNGKFADAKKKAIAYAAQRGIGSIKVEP